MTQIWSFELIAYHPAFITNGNGQSQMTENKKL